MTIDLAVLTWVAGLLATGMGVALLGSVKLPLSRRLDIGEARVGGLVSMFGLAMIPVILAMGFLTDSFGPQFVAVGGSFLMAVSLAVLSRSGRYWSALVAVLLLSAGWSALINVLNVGMQDAFGGSGTYAMNLGNFFFGLGAFLTPLVIAFLLRRTGFAAALLMLGVFSLVSGLLALGADFPALTEEAKKAAPSIGVLLANPVLWLTAIAMLFYAPMEATMAAWATTYLGDSGVSEGQAAGFLSGFWLAFMGTRLATALLVSAFPLAVGGDTALIIALAALCVFVWLGAVFSPGRRVAIAMVICAGLVFGPTFPTIVGVLVGNVEPALRGRAVGIFFAVGGIGWSIIPMLIGAYARKTSVQRGFLVAVGAAVGLFVTSLALHFTMAA